MKNLLDSIQEVDVLDEERNGNYKDCDVNNQYKERLKKIIGKKIETTMIYPLSQIEMVFGHLWGHNKPFSALTDDEKVNRGKWDQCRNNILNNGNQQKRNAFAELDMHTITWNRYQVVLVPRK
jgi:hypothetical protein